MTRKCRHLISNTAFVFAASTCLFVCSQAQQDTTPIGTQPITVGVPGRNSGNGPTDITTVHIDPKFSAGYLHHGYAPVLIGCAYGDWSFETSGPSANTWTPAGAFRGRCPVNGTGVDAADAHSDMTLANGGIGGDYWIDLDYPIGVQGQNWVTSKGTTGVGTLTSVSTALEHRYVTFLMGGVAALDTYVALQMQTDDLQSLQNGSPPGHPPGSNAPDHPDLYTEIGRLSNAISEPDLKRYWFDVPSLLQLDPSLVLNHSKLLWAHPARIRIVIQAGHANDTEYINVDDFEFADTPPNVLTVSRQGATVNFDTDHPVWGVADTHAHPAAHLGFGARMIIGDPSTASVDDAYSTQDCKDNHSNLAVTIQDHHTALGAPTYVGFPRFSVGLHSVYQREFLRRAWQGGVRLLVALAINDQYLATRALGTGVKAGTPTDDHSQVQRQLAFIEKTLVGPSDFMGVARTPLEARTLILSGKMAIVMGIEVNTFGDFKDASWVWVDDTSNNTQPLVTLSDDPTTANAQVTSTVKIYQDMGVRQVTAIHYVNGLFGGPPLMRPETLFIDKAYTGVCEVYTEGKQANVALNLTNDDYGLRTHLESIALGLADLDPNQINQYKKSCSINADPSNFVSTLNSQDLTPRGTQLYTALMRQGMLIDTEHTSFATKDSIIALANSFKYPVMSSHSDPTMMAFRPASWPPNGTDPSAWINLNKNQQDDQWGTTNPANLANEFSVRDSDLDAIQSSGGTIGLFLVPWRKPDYLGTWKSDGGSGQVRNNNAGSTKSWAQAFLYAAEKMNGRGVALASDRAAIESIAPRFGVYGSWGYTATNEPTISGADSIMRRKQRWAQSSSSDPEIPWGSSIARDVRNVVDQGVQYDVPIKSFHPLLYQDGLDNSDNGFEEDAWKARAYIQAYPGADPGASTYNSLPAAGSVTPDTPQKVPLGVYVSHENRIEDFVRGWYAKSPAQLKKPGAGVGDRAYEEAVFYAVHNGLSACALSAPSYNFGISDLGYGCYPLAAVGNGISVQGQLTLDFNTAKAVDDLWKAMGTGTQRPLHRLITGSRYWDFNLDGMAHYGLIPDFLQDLRNIGINAPQMDTLFESAEDYIRMWQRAQDAAKAMP